jgi:serine/threonine protein kinase
MSPERILGKSYTKAADIWSLGISLMVYATNMCPYPINGYWILSEAIQHGPSMHSLVKLPDDFKDFICKCVAIEEQDRESAENLLKHPFIKNFLTRSIENGKDPTKLRNFKLIDSNDDREGDLNFILDLLIKIMLEKHIQILRAAEIGVQANPFEVLEKIQLAWLSYQLFLDFDYVQRVYDDKIKEATVFLESALVQRFTTLKMNIDMK